MQALRQVVEVIREFVEARSPTRTDARTGQPWSAFPILGDTLLGLPGVRLIEGGEIWLRIERQDPTPPPQPSSSLAFWLDGSNDPEREPRLNDVTERTVTGGERERLIREGRATATDFEPLSEGTFRVHLARRRFPEVDQAFADYLSQWRAWSAEEIPRRRAHSLYVALHALRRDPQAEPGEDPLDLVWGFGLCLWEVNDVTLYFPLVFQPIDVLDGPAVGGRPTLDLMPRSGEPHIAFSEIAKIDTTAAQHLAKAWGSRADDTLFDPRDVDTWEPVVETLVHHFHPNARFIGRAQLPKRLPPAGLTPTVFAESILFVRRQRIAAQREDALQWLDLFNKDTPPEIPAPVRVLLTESADEPNGEVPSDALLGVPHALDLGLIYFPKPFNEEQLKALLLLERSPYGTLVQGPPGTGKSHTIANIICHALATGRRVLVTAKNPGALSVVRDYLPETLRPLAVSLVAGQREIDRQIGEAVKALLAQVNQNIETLKCEVEQAERKLGEIRTGLGKVREDFSEQASRHEGLLKKVLVGRRGETPDVALKEFFGEEPRHAWFLDKRTLSMQESHAPPLTDEDAATLQKERARLGSAIEHVEGDLPDPAELPGENELVSLHKALSIPSARRLPVLQPYSREISKRLDELCAYRAFRFPEPSLPDWAERQICVWCNGPIDPDLQPLQQRALDLRKRLEWFAKERCTLAQGGVIVPVGFEKVPEFVESVERAASHGSPLPISGFLRFHLKALLKQVTVAGQKPRSKDQWHLVKREIDWRKTWPAVEEESKRLLPVADLLHGNPSIGGNKNAVDAFLGAMDSFCTAIVAAIRCCQLRSAVQNLFGFTPGPQAILHDPALLDRAIETLIAMAADASRKAILGRVANLRGDIGQRFRDLLGNLGDSAIEDVAGRWNALRDELLMLRQHYGQSIATIRELTARIEKAGGQEWAKRLRTEPVAESGDPLVPPEWREAWEWYRRAGELAHANVLVRFKEIATRRSRLEAEARRSLEKVVEARTKVRLKDRLKAPVINALNAYQKAVRKIGAGTGKAAPKWRRVARLHLNVAASAIPCWIMAEDRVSSDLPQQPRLFDLIIVDEASQSDLTAFLVLLRGEKVLVVGDDRQVSPEFVGIDSAQWDEWERRLVALPESRRRFVIQDSLYELASISFGGAQLMLKEHFRCHPAIIGFSNERFYGGEIKPLRVPTLAECPNPIVIDMQVEALVIPEETQINSTEIEKIVAEAKRLIEIQSAENRKKSIGIVAMIAGSGQARALHDKLLDEIGDDAWRAHQVYVGTPADFQGKERDIVFLSLVQRPGHMHALTGKRWEQRFNVAVSRARDRLYVVRSFARNHLINPNDLKYKLLDYVERVANQGPPPFEDLEPLLEACQSEFERDVLRAIYGRGYRVLPQHPVGPYRIDLVVEDDDGHRLAIELDGDAYHNPERWGADLFRQRVMERAGWHFWRCFASEWYSNPSGYLDDLLRTLESEGVRPVTRQGKIAHGLVEVRKPGGDAIADVSGPCEPPPIQAVGNRMESPHTSATVQPASGLRLPSADNRRVEAGDLVRILYVDTAREAEVQIVNGPHDPQAGVIGSAAPLARALIGAEVGEQVEAPLPAGTKRVRIIAIHKPTGS